MEQPQNRYTFQIAKRRFVAVEEGLRNNAIAVGAVLLLGTSSCTFSRTCTNAEETRRLTDTSVALPRLSLCLPPRHHKTGGIPRKNKDLHRRSRWLWRVLIVLGPWTSTRHAAQPAFHLTLLFASSCQRRPHRPAVWEDDRSFDTHSFNPTHAHHHRQARPQQATTTHASDKTDGGAARAGGCIPTRRVVWASTSLYKSASRPRRWSTLPTWQ